METEFELADELYETKKIVKATITYTIDVNKDNVFITEIEDFDTSWQTQEDYNDLKRTDIELRNSSIYELAEIIYNAVKYNNIEEQIALEITEL